MICVDKLPKEWNPMPDNTICKTVTLDASSDEYSQVKRLFTATMPTPQQQSSISDLQWHHIVKIERIQNPALYTRYATRKKDIGERNSSGLKNERKLFYGCTQDVADKIIHWGFSTVFAGNNGMHYMHYVMF